jgi:hypothetical protein
MTAFADADGPARVRALAGALIDTVLEDPRKSRLFLVEPYSPSGLGRTTFAVMPDPSGMTGGPAWLHSAGIGREPPEPRAVGHQRRAAVRDR